MTRHVRLLEIVAAGSLALSTMCVGCRDNGLRLQRLDPSTVRRIDGIAGDFMDRRSVPGLAIAVASRGRLLYSRGYGVAAFSGDRAGPVTERTLFELGSIKKPLTAAIVLRLAERGLLDVDDPADRWIERIATDADPPVRLRDMFNQVSGLPNVDDDAVIRELDFEPGTRWAYRNANFDLLDGVVEKAAGEPFGEVLRGEMMEPLGFHTLAMCDPKDPGVDGMAQGYTLRSGALEPVADACWLRGAPSELALWVDALFSGRIIGRAALAEMTTPVILADGTRRDYGFGLLLRPLHGIDRWSHTGHVDGFTAAFGFYPAAGLTIALAGNSDSLFDPDAIEVAIATELLGLPPSRPGPVEIGDAERFRGTYDAGEAWFHVGPGGGDALTLTMTPPAEGAKPYFSTRLTRVGAARYVGADSPDVIEARFVTTDDREAPVGATFNAVGLPWEASRRLDDSVRELHR